MDCNLSTVTIHEIHEMQVVSKKKKKEKERKKELIKHECLRFLKTLSSRVVLVQLFVSTYLVSEPPPPSTKLSEKM